MPRRLSAAIVAFLAPFLFYSCQPTPEPPSPPTQNTFFLYRFEPPAFIEFSEEFQTLGEFPFSIPVNCGLYEIFPAPRGPFMVVELSCPNGQTVLFLDTSKFLSTGSSDVAITQPAPNTDSHFLAWGSDGSAAFLKVDSFSDPRILRASPQGSQEILAIDEFTYDLAARPESVEYIFTFSRGMGYGSELYLGQGTGQNAQLLYSDISNYISFARFSPDGNRIAFIKVPDSQTPFTVGELWTMDADGLNARRLAEADAGHGYAANWSPDGAKIAFVVRENPEDGEADQSSEALISNIYTVEVESGEVKQITTFEEGRAETPHWSPDGNTLTFNAVGADGRMTVFLAVLASGETRPLVAGPACCPAWIRK